VFRLNANTNRVAMGFTIEELPKLAVTKSVDNTSTLLECVPSGNTWVRIDRKVRGGGAENPDARESN